MSRFRYKILFLALAVAACTSGEPREGAAADDPDDRMAAEHVGDSPEPTPAATSSPASEVQAERVSYGSIKGVSLEGYMARPASGTPRAGILVVHEWWGLNANIEAVTRRLAGEGYVALAVDLYGGQVASEPDAARALMQSVSEDATMAELKLVVARTHLAAQTVGDETFGKVGIIGWCFGGGWSLRTAVTLGDDIDAAVMFYGRVMTDAHALAGLTAPLLGHFASEDHGIPIEDVRAMEAALATAGKSAEIHVYDGADHAFANPSGTRYDAEAAELAWSRTTAFFATHLGG